MQMTGRLNFPLCPEQAQNPKPIKIPVPMLNL